MSKIGLSAAGTKKIAEGLDELLANYQVFYMNTRGFHWNIKGEKFFELHVKFEELYDDLFLKIDEVAERILTLGYTPSHSFHAYQKLAKVKPVQEVSNGKKCVKEILNAFEIIIKLQRKLLALTDKHDDEGSNALMSDYIREQEKLVWMYSAFLGE